MWLGADEAPEEMGLCRRSGLWRRARARGGRASAPEYQLTELL